MHTVLVTTHLSAGAAANGGPELRVLASLDNNTMGADAKAQAKARRKVGEPALPSVGDMPEPTDEPSTPTAAVAPADRAVSLPTLCFYPHLGPMECNTLSPASSLSWDLVLQLQ